MALKCINRALHISKTHFFALKYINRVFRKLKICTSRILDLGYGAGELVIPLAKYFEKVLAPELDQDMLNEGFKKANKHGASNIE
jgi:2-polyprenyl-3-methyl-5-hydroxy-6-metoxy-1,4-benzoquinol methylase